MKRLAMIMAMLLIPALLAVGQERTKSVMTRVSGGSVTLTNDLRVTTSELPLRPALELKRIEFTLPTAALTNAFQIGYTREYELPMTVTTLVVTNSSLVFTNTIHYAGSTRSYTNTITVATTTNDAGIQIYDEDDFDKGLTFEPNDVITYSFTETSAFDLIQVYTIRARP